MKTFGDAKFVDTEEEATHIGFVFYVATHGCDENNPPKDFKSLAIIDVIAAEKAHWQEALKTMDQAIMYICNSLYHDKRMDVALGINMFMKLKYFKGVNTEDVPNILTTDKDKNTEALKWLKEKMKDENPEKN